MVDGLFIRTLLLAFFFKLFPEIIQDGRIFIAEPPLYRVKDKKNPFVINNDDYINRYITDVVKSYRVGIGDIKKTPVFMNKTELREFLSDTSSYTDDIEQLARHYKINEYLMEIILYQFGLTGMKLSEEVTVDALLKNLNIQKLMTRINEDFPEIRYDDEHKLIAGSIDGKYQSIEITERIVRKGMNIIRTFIKYECQIEKIIMQESKTNVLNEYPLLTALKILKKFQPEIEHYFKGLTYRSYLLNCGKPLTA